MDRFQIADDPRHPKRALPLQFLKTQILRLGPADASGLVTPNLAVSRYGFGQGAVDDDEAADGIATVAVASDAVVIVRLAHPQSTVSLLKGANSIFPSSANSQRAPWGSALFSNGTWAGAAGLVPCRPTGDPLPLVGRIDWPDKTAVVAQSVLGNCLNGRSGTSCCPCPCTVPCGTFPMPACISRWLGYMSVCCTRSSRLDRLHLTSAYDPVN